MTEGPQATPAVPSAPKRAWFRSGIADFLKISDSDVLGRLVMASGFAVQDTQRNAWLAELEILRESLPSENGTVFLEFTIPRMGARADTVLLIRGVLFVIEFKVGAARFLALDSDQVCDYALDLKNFHEGSHDPPVVPILVATNAETEPPSLRPHVRIHNLYEPIRSSGSDLKLIIQMVLDEIKAPELDAEEWEGSRYCPTPTIIEAARALYAGHRVAEISRHESGAINLRETTDRLCSIIDHAQKERSKAICFVTGVPGAGKTLVGLNLATKYNDPKSELHSVYLSGNGPLVKVLCESLARDLMTRTVAAGGLVRKGEARSKVKAFIQNVHHFRDECLRDRDRAPVDHVALFDEAQRAWDLEQTANFMLRKKGVANFNESEPEFLISCMDRRTDWAVVVCLVGDGQEINTGEAGIGAWLEAIAGRFGSWQVHAATDLLQRPDEALARAVNTLRVGGRLQFYPDLHLSVSMRAFRSERLSEMVAATLDRDPYRAAALLKEVRDTYPIVLTRKLDVAKDWLRRQATGSERYGMLVSSRAARLRPFAMDVRAKADPVKYFLEDKDHVDSSYFLEEVATEFDVQGLELDWACVSWDGDFRSSGSQWDHYEFRGRKWQRVRDQGRRQFQKNAYRVLLTRARQGMVMFVPEGNRQDPTRLPAYYDGTYEYLRSIGITEL